MDVIHLYLYTTKTKDRKLMNKMTFNRTALALIISASLIGCGSDGDDSSNEPVDKTTYSGKISVEGIQSAEVFLDINQSGQRDEGEPHAFVGTNGQYNFEAGKEYINDVAFAPVIAKITDDQGYEYVLARAPEYQGKNNKTNRVISPLTTMEWLSVPLPVTPEGNEYSSSMSSNDKTYAFFDQQKAVFKLKNILTEEYGLKANEMYQDYLSDSASYELRQVSDEILTGLKDLSTYSSASYDVDKKGALMRKENGNTFWYVSTYTVNGNEYTITTEKHGDYVGNLLETSETKRTRLEKEGTLYYMEEVKRFSDNCEASKMILESNADTGSGTNYEYIENVVKRSSKNGCDNISSSTEITEQRRGNISTNPDGVFESYMTASANDLQEFNFGEPTYYEFDWNEYAYGETGLVGDIGMTIDYNDPINSSVYCRNHFKSEFREVIKMGMNTGDSSFYVADLYEMSGSDSSCVISKPSHLMITVTQTGNVDVVEETN